MRTLIRISLSLGLILILMLGSTLTVHAQDPEVPVVRITQVDNSNFPNVTVYVSATNAAGEPIGIDPSTVQIFENGQVMQLVDVQGGGEVASEESIPVTTMLVFDISGSMEKNDKFAGAKEAAKSYVSQMRPGDQAGLIAYDSNVYTIQPITTDAAALTAAIDGLQTGSDTAMYDAIMEAVTALESASGRKAIIVLTDGMDNQSSNNLETVLAGIDTSGLTISAIGFGDVAASGQSGLDEAGLQSLSERAGGVYGFASSADVLAGIFEQQSRVLQSEYRLTYVSPSTLRDGVNRNLTVALTGTPAIAEETYNPGGVLPEVTASSWPLFLTILVGLLVLLLLPWLIGVISGAFRGRKPGSGFGLGKQAQAARGRIKLK
ncbi:MAG TPA: VWA domain-containing protein [Anaerolineales bacterium]|nr:VWA domain-containing protein [Anaerolineales bacterium]